MRTRRAVGRQQSLGGEKNRSRLRVRTASLKLVRMPLASPTDPMSLVPIGPTIAIPTATKQERFLLEHHSRARAAREFRQFH